MPSFKIKTNLNDEQIFKSKSGKFHDFEIKPIDGTMTAGSLTIKLKGVGSSLFVDPPNNVIDLSDPKKIQTTGSVEEYSFKLSNFVGTAQNLLLTDDAGWK